MTRNTTTVAVLAALCALAGLAPAQTNLIANPGFFDLDTDTNFGDGWAAFGAAGFNEFFGAGNPHASLFADTIGNTGGVFQGGIAATPGERYRFDAANIRIESNFDGTLRIALEFYAADDTTKLSEEVFDVPPGTTGDGLAYTIRAVAPAGAAFVRPLISYDSVQTTGGTDRNVFVFRTALFASVPGTPLLLNWDIEDTSADGDPEDNWGVFAACDFNAFFGTNGHASLFGDNAANFGGFFQLGIPAEPGVTYQFDLLDTRIEENWEADVFMGLEYYAADDGTKLGETVVFLDTATRVSNGSVDGNVFSIRGTAVPGTTFIRPIVQFENVNGGYVNQPQANTFIFRTFLGEAPLPGDAYARNPAFQDFNGDNVVGDLWSSFGAAGFNTFFGDDNPHASLFADTIGNFGGIYQSGIIADPNATYRFDLLDVRIEANFDADLRFGVEFYAGDDTTKVGESIQVIDTSTTGDGLSFSTTGQAPFGARFVRPIVEFDNVGTTGGTDRSAFIFAAALTETTGLVPCEGDVTGDNMVDLNDLALVLANFGASGSTGDADGDGSVGLSDLALVLANFGLVCP